MGVLLSAIYDPLIAPLDSMGVRQWREWVVRAAHGCVLEVGVGTGLNMSHYHGGATVAAIDPDWDSLRRAKWRQNGSTAMITLYQARAEELPFANESFDAVIGTLVLCTVVDLAGALGEVRRVLKPGGTLRVVEHVRVKNRMIAGAQDIFTPLWKEIAGGCHLNRDTLASVERVGFHVQEMYQHIGGLFIGIDAVK